MFHCASNSAVASIGGYLQNIQKTYYNNLHSIKTPSNRNKHRHKPSLLLTSLNISTWFHSERFTWSRGRVKNVLNLLLAPASKSIKKKEYENMLFCRPNLTILGATAQCWHSSKNRPQRGPAPPPTIFSSSKPQASSLVQMCCGFSPTLCCTLVHPPTQLADSVCIGK